MFQYLLLLETDEEREFFTEIYEKYQNDMFRIANGILHNSSDAEDMVHETFVSLIQYVDRIINSEPYKVWYYIKITLQHRAINLYRQRKQRGEVGLDESWTQEDIFDKDVALILEEAEEHNLLLSLVKRLKVSYQEVLILQYYYDLSTKEIADVLGKTEDNVRHISKRAKEKLKALVEENHMWNEKKSGS